MQTKYFFITVFLVLIFLTIYLWNELSIKTITCKIIELQQQQLIKGTDNNVTTDIRYLIITDKETFISESSIVNGKFNNSDVFFRLKKDSTYKLKFAGFGKSFITDYRNIIKVIQ